ncbi:hypothetical protein ABKN59_009913 [Abortiporus biennis]
MATMISQHSQGDRSDLLEKPKEVAPKVTSILLVHNFSAIGVILSTFWKHIPVNIVALNLANREVLSSSGYLRL